MPAPDPKLRKEPPHDVLAAEEFAMPAPDPVLHRAVTPPPHPNDPDGSEDPHDVLAAEEFAMPAGRVSVDVAPPTGSALRDWSPRVAVGVAALLFVGGVASKLRRRG